MISGTVGPDPGQPVPVVDAGYPLRGGRHPESSVVANLLARHGVRLAATGAPLGEALVFGIGGGLGAGYILWEFAAQRTRSVTLGFRNRWQYPTWPQETLARLDVPADVHRTCGAKGAARALAAALDAGRPAIVLPDRQLVGYWHLPAHLDGYGGHPVVAYALTGDRVHLDDRNLSPLTVPRADLDAARARVVSYRNLLVVPRPAAELTIDDAALRRVVSVGLADCVARLTDSSTSFGLPAWRKWARLMTDPRNAKGWPTVFADRAGLVGALLSVWEGITPAGMTGGNLRGLYADFLTEAAELLDAPGLLAPAGAFRAAATAWQRVAEAVLPADVPPFARLRALTAAVSGGITAHGDAGAPMVAEAAAALWALRGEYDAAPPLDDPAVAELLAATGRAVAEVYAAETAAAECLVTAVAALPPVVSMS